RQVYLRDLDARTTRLITTKTTGGDPAGGAFGPVAVSGDGSTVSWTGQNAPDQTRFITGEIQDPSLSFYLWKRVADGPTAATRRVTGFVDPDDPGCGPGGSVTTSPTATGPCYGPLTTQEQGVSSISTQVPSLSDDGWTVVFTTPTQARGDLNSG